MSDITTDLITTTKKLYGKVSAIINHLQIIERDVKSISEQSVKSGNPPTANADHANPEDNSANSIITNHSESGEFKRKRQSAEDQQSSAFQNFRRKWWKNVKKPKLQIEIAALIGLFLYTCETRRTNNLTEKNLALTRESIAAQITTGDWDFVDPIVPGQKIVLKVPLTNIGRSPAVYGIESLAFRWTRMPDNIPIAAPEPSVVMEPSKPTPNLYLIRRPLPRNSFTPFPTLTN